MRSCELGNLDAKEEAYNLALKSPLELEIRGSLLIAHPHLAGDFFDRSVIYVLEHNENGSFGFIINQLSDLMLCELLESTSDRDRARQVYIGGPVGLDHLYFLHPSVGEDDQYSGTSNQAPIVQPHGALCSVSAIAPEEDPFLPLLGYSGWGPGQLEEEISHDVWLLAPAATTLIFDRERSDIWDASLASLGISSSAIAPMQSHRQ